MQKALTFSKSNVCPSTEKGLRGRLWDVSKTTKEKEITVAYVEKDTFIGVSEVNNDEKFFAGSLIVDSDEAFLCYIDKITFMTLVSE